MADVDGSFLHPHEKRAAIERGDAVFYPWGGTPRSLIMNAADIMGSSNTKYLTELELADGWQSRSDSVHKAWIRPLQLVPPSSSEPLTSDLIILPDQAE